MVQVDHKVVLIVIDGWGIPSESSRPDGDAIGAAETPVMDAFSSPNSETAQGYTELEASSLAVGLPEGLMGNSEVGHMNLGAGRVCWQDVVRIDQTLKRGEFNTVQTLTDCFQRAIDGNGRLHLLGLVSDGGVHSHINHLVGLLKVAKEMNVPKVFVHFFGDGRDTDPKSAAGYMEDLLGHFTKIGIGEIATVVGRYYIMDRDKRWDRVEIGMKGVVTGEGEESTDPVATIKDRYSKGENDEFLKPIIVGGQEARVQDNDTLFFFNYRSDRVREVTQLLGDIDRSPKPDFPYPENISIATMTQYKTDYPFPIAFRPQGMDNVLAEYLGAQGVKQCHIAETEKYAHVTFFFNGGVEKQFQGEDRDLIPSPKVATYDLDPKMSSGGVADKLCERIREGKYEFLMNNFAPPDMVGHTGVYEAAIQGVAATDAGIGQVYETCKKEGYVLFVTSDHGNAEEMLNEEGKPKTSHTTNKVPFVMANAPQGWSLTKQDGVLGDVAPTVLEVMGLNQPQEMGGTMASRLTRSRLWPPSQQAFRGLETATPSDDNVPYRKQLKDEAKRKRAAGEFKGDPLRKSKDARAERWKLTVGIEVHAQLNTERKLFSRARTSTNAEPNTRVAFFDLAYPGAQPNFQKATLIPALRAAIALNCNIQRKSRFDRKHYFYPDQPAGYQITQYYKPYAKDGNIILYDHDGIAPEDGKSVTVGIKQIQMEQDTAKTIQQDSVTLLDFNRVGHPLIEIITLPHIHHPQTATACVQKIQAILQTVNAVTTGMEMGGLRADVNVSIRPKDQDVDAETSHEYSGVTGLGQRTEIKNLSSFKAIEDAIIAERDRQIETLESGGVIEGETRGWTLGSTETTRLRGKEGEIDYRYMPDADLAPVVIGEVFLPQPPKSLSTYTSFLQDLIAHLTQTLPELPDTTLKELVGDFNISIKDAKTLISLDNGERLQLFDKVLALLVKYLQDPSYKGTISECLVDPSVTQVEKAKIARIVANWVIHELGALIKSSHAATQRAHQNPAILARILRALLTNQITGKSAKTVLELSLCNEKGKSVEDIIKEQGLEIQRMSDKEYDSMARRLIGKNEDMAEKVKKGEKGKLMWFVGQMMREGKGSVEAEKARGVLEELLMGEIEGKEA